MNFECFWIMQKSDLKLRTKQFALRIIRLVRALPKTTEGRAIGMQIIRSGTSVAANYRSACRARSVAEFIAKLGIVLEEADETGLWLELIIESGLIQEKLVIPLLRESSEIVAIMTSSVISAGKRIKK